MKRKLLYGAALTLGAAASISGGSVFAASHPVSTAADLADCFADTDVDITCNIQTGAWFSRNNIVIDSGLNVADGHNVTLNLGYNAITASSSFPSGIGVITVDNGGSLTINAERSIRGNVGTIDGTNTYSAVRMTRKGDYYNPAKTAKLVVNGGHLIGSSAGITGNGSRQNTEITINGGTIQGLTENDSTGIFHPQDGLLTVNGGEISGAMGIYMKSGGLVVADGHISGNGAKADYVASGNGFNNTGDAIVIDNSNYPGGTPEAQITGGVIESANNQAVASYGVSEVIPEVTGGSFKGNPNVKPAATTDGYDYEYNNATGRWDAKKKVDLTALDAAINQSRARNNIVLVLPGTRYSENSWNDLQSVLSEAQELRAGAEGKFVELQPAVDTMTSRLNTADGNLVNISELRNTIAAENTMARIAAATDDYTQSSLKAYQDSIDAANNTLADPTLKGQAGRDAVEAAIDGMSTARNALTRKANTARLQTLFNSVKGTICADGQTSGCIVIKEDSDLDKAYKAAQNLLAEDLEESRQEEVNSAVSNLVQAWAYEIGNTESLREAAKAIARVAELNEDDYTKESFSEVSKAYDELTKYIADHADDDTSAADYRSELDSHTDALNDAIDSLVEAADKEALQELVEEAESVDREKFTDASIAELDAALESAEEILEQDLSKEKQEVVDGAYQALRDAMDNLAERADTSALQEEVIEARAIEAGEYTEESFENLQKAIKEAEEVLDRDLSIDEQEIVNGALQALRDAKAALVKKEIKAPDTGDNQNMNTPIIASVLASATTGSVLALALFFLKRKFNKR